MQLVKKIGGGIVAAALILGLKFYNKSSSQDDMKAQLVKLCEGDSGCLANVNEHYTSCFDDNYRMKRRGSGLNMSGFLSCFNQKSGKQYFSMKAH